jgi:O-antigen/teichoic acid export membrane protein
VFFLKLKSRKLVDNKSRDVFKNMAILFVGTSVSKIIGLASIPILTRIYSPEDFGVLSIFMAAIAIIVPLTSMRYVVAVPLPKNDKLALNLFALCFILVFCVTIVISFLLWMFGPYFFEITSQKIPLSYIWLVSLGVFVTSVYEIFTYWATRKKSFSILTKVSVYQTLIGSFIKIVLGLLNFKPVGLLFGQVVQQGGGIVLFLRNFWEFFKLNYANIRMRRITFLFKYYKDFPLYQLPSQFVLMLSSHSLLLFSAAMYGTGLTGQLGLAIMTVSLPMQLLSQTMGKAYYAEISETGAQQQDKIKSLSFLVMKRIFILGLIPSIFIALGSEFLFPLVFGSEWAQAGVFASIMVVYMFFQFVSIPFVNLFILFKRQRYLLIMNLIRLVIMLTVFSIVYLFRLDGEFFVSLLSYSMAMFYLLVIVFLYFFWNNINHFDKNI